MPEKDDIAGMRSRNTDDRLRELASQGRLAMPTRDQPERAPRLVKTDRSASSLVLAERGHAVVLGPR